MLYRMVVSRCGHEGSSITGRPTMEVPSVILVAFLVLFSTLIPAELVQGAPLPRRQHGAARKAAARPKNALRQLLTPQGKELGLQRMKRQPAEEEASDTEGAGGDPPQAPPEMDGVLAPKFYPVGPAEPVEPGLPSSESERHGGREEEEEEEQQERGGGHREDDDDGQDRGQDYGEPDHDDESRRGGGGGHYGQEDRARAEEEDRRQEEEEERRRQQESYDPYGGQRGSHEGHQDGYGGHQDSYGDHRDPYSNEYNPYSSSRSYNPYHEYQQLQYERMREYQDRYMRMMEELGVPGVWVDGRFRRQDNADQEGVHDAYYAARGPHSRHPYDY
ncbi:uncharacterized protein LOC144732580 isoform X1 [Lampetra planeri]